MPLRVKSLHKRVAINRNGKHKSEHFTQTRAKLKTVANKAEEEEASLEASQSRKS
jgi:hypothetical protein